MISIATEYEFKHTDFHLCMMPSDPETLKLPNHLERISANAFDGISVQKIVFSAFVPTIEANAFANIENLLMVQLPFYYGYNGVDPYAFAGSTPFGSQSQLNPSCWPSSTSWASSSLSSNMHAATVLMAAT